MHNASLKVDHIAVLVAVNRCGMRDCVWPNMVIVAVKKSPHW